MGAAKAKPVEMNMEEILAKEGGAATEKVKVQKVRGKAYKANRAKVNRDRLYPLAEAISLVKETSYSKFDGTVELHLLVKKEGISSNVTLPHATGKTKKVEVADENTIEKLKAGKIDFDILLTTPEMMPKLVAFARLLGPRGLMPNPKTGTIIKTVEDAKKFSADALSVKTERKAPIVHTIAGKVSMDEKALKENVEVIFKAMGKGQILKAYLKATMGPSVKLQIS